MTAPTAPPTDRVAAALDAYLAASRERSLQAGIIAESLRLDLARGNRLDREHYRRMSGEFERLCAVERDADTGYRVAMAVRDAHRRVGV